MATVPCRSLLSCGGENPTPPRYHPFHWSGPVDSCSELSFLLKTIKTVISAQNGHFWHSSLFLHFPAEGGFSARFDLISTIENNAQCLGLILAHKHACFDQNRLKSGHFCSKSGHFCSILVLFGPFSARFGQETYVFSEKHGPGTPNPNQ